MSTFPQMIMSLIRPAAAPPASRRWCTPEKYVGLTVSSARRKLRGSKRSWVVTRTATESTGRDRARRDRGEHQHDEFDPIAQHQRDHADPARRQYGCGTVRFDSVYIRMVWRRASVVLSAPKAMAAASWHRGDHRVDSGRRRPGGRCRIGFGPNSIQECFRVESGSPRHENT